MPVHKVSGGYQWGKSGKIYKNKEDAEKQGRAVYASGYKGENAMKDLHTMLKETKKLLVKSILECVFSDLSIDKDEEGFGSKYTKRNQERNRDMGQEFDNDESDTDIKIKEEK